MNALKYRRTDGTFIALINGLPYHVTAEDNEALFSAAQVLAGEMGDDLPFEPAPPEEDFLPAVSISDRQFFQQMANDGRITQQEALDAVGSGVIPAAMDALIDQLPPEDRFAARMLVRGATMFLREHPVTVLIGQLYGMTGADIDQLWQEASAL